MKYKTKMKLDKVKKNRKKIIAGCACVAAGVCGFFIGKKIGLRDKYVVELNLVEVDPTEQS